MTHSKIIQDLPVEQITLPRLKVPRLSNCNQCLQSPFLRVEDRVETRPSLTLIRLDHHHHQGHPSNSAILMLSSKFLALKEIELKKINTMRCSLGKLLQVIACRSVYKLTLISLTRGKKLVERINTQIHQKKFVVYGLPVKSTLLKMNLTLTENHLSGMC